jgi:hypothetical protein
MIPDPDPFALPVMVNVGAVPGAATARAVREMVDPDDRSLAWYLQGRSIMAGGLKLVAEEIWQASARERLGSSAMHRLGRDLGKRYTGDEYLSVYADLNEGKIPPEIQSERNSCYAHLLARTARSTFPEPDSEWSEREVNEARVDRAAMEERIRGLCQAPVREMLAQCATLAAVQIPESLHSFAFEGRPITSICFRDLRTAVEENFRAFTGAAERTLAPTATAKAVLAELDSIAGAQTLGLFQGETREGKTTAAQAFVRKNLHRCRYASLEDDLSDRRFYEILVNAVSCPIDARWVKDDFRAAITGALVGSGLMLVIDEAHNLFPRNPKSRPVWLEWVRTALVDRGVSVALISTPQFVSRIHTTAQASGWQSDQFTGRIGKLRTIERLAEDDQAGWDQRREDVAAVARCHLPEADTKAISYMAEIAIMGRTPFHLVATMARDARESARRRGGAVQYSDIRSAAEKAAQFNGRIFQALQPPKKQRAEVGAVSRRREVILPNRPSVTSLDSGGLEAPLSERAGHLKGGLRAAEAAQNS